MALKSETKTINGHTYDVTQLPYSQGKSLLMRLFKCLGPAMAKALGVAPELKDRKLSEMKLSEVAPVLGVTCEQLAQDLSEEDFDFAVALLGQYSYVIGDTGARQQLTSDFLEFHFAGNYGELFQWLAFALRVNYLGFLRGRALDGLAQEMAQKTNP